MQTQAQVDKLAFECLFTIKKRLHSNTTDHATTGTETSVTKLPKLKVPTFHGDILQWKSYWEQFCVSVHHRSNPTKAEKLVYLQNSIKNKAAKCLNKGLTKSSEHYDKTVKSLLFRYDRPCLIHQTHVCRIIDAQPLKDDTGKEIRALHNLVVQHLRALRTLGHKSLQSFSLLRFWK